MVQHLHNFRSAQFASTKYCDFRGAISMLEAMIKTYNANVAGSVLFPGRDFQLLLSCLRWSSFDKQDLTLDPTKTRNGILSKECPVSRIRVQQSLRKVQK